MAPEILSRFITGETFEIDQDIFIANNNFYIKKKHVPLYNSPRSALIRSSAFCERGLIENLKGLG